MIFELFCPTDVNEMMSIPTQLLLEIVVKYSFHYSIIFYFQQIWYAKSGILRSNYTGNWKALIYITAIGGNSMNNTTVYVSDQIGNDYTRWKSADIIKITAPTGSGKTHFILHTLLPFAIANNLKILYLVNRTILKGQIEHEIKNLFYSQYYELFDNLQMFFNFINVKTYQQIETDIKNDIRQTQNYLAHFYYVIFDECHYFYADSNFNTSTELSFHILKNSFCKKTQIFISATMKHIEQHIGLPISVNNISDTISKQAIMLKISSEPQIYEYHLECNYNYLTLTLFSELDEIGKYIAENKSKDKWLIFIDTIKNGKVFAQNLIKNSIADKSDIVIITSDYKYNDDTDKEVQNLISENYIDKRIVISTSVLDNGISFQDPNLKNIVIMADTEESFIQMLGRKRADGDKVNLYICRRDITHFTKRLQYIQNSLDTLYTCSHLIPDFNYEQKPTEQYSQQRLLDMLMTQKRIYNTISKTCFVYNGIITMNSFSKKRLLDLRSFYTDIIEALKKDPNAFVRKQSDWLNLSDEEYQAIITDRLELYKQSATNTLSKYVGKALPKDVRNAIAVELELELSYFVKFIKMNFKDQIISNGVKIPTIEKDISSKRMSSQNHFNFIMDAVDLPFKIAQEKKGSNYFITQKS